MSKLSNAFYRIGDFLGGAEKQFFSSFRLMDTKGEIYVDTKVPYKLFYEIPELHQVVSKKASMFSNGVFKLVEAENPTVEVEDPELMRLLGQPNILQSQNKWLHNYSEQLDVYGNQFMYFNKPSALMTYPKSIVNISPRYLNPLLSGKYYDQTDIEGVVKRYNYDDNDTVRSYETRDILWTKHDDLDNPVVGKSPLVSLKFPLSNTKLAYQYFNIIGAKKGAIGMIATTQKDSEGALPMDDEDKKALENKFSNDYGVHDGAQSAVAIVDGQVTWQPMTYPTKDLLLQEQIDANKLTIVDQYGLDINIFSSKNSTYENVRQALIGSYNNSIYPAADAFTQSLSKQLKIDPKYKLILDYSHLSILQEDKTEKANTLKAQFDAVSQAVQAGLISRETATEVLNNSFSLDLPTPPTPEAPTE